ncbi:hypothetical protein Dimus_019747 [Dionaea muscipula]
MFIAVMCICFAIGVLMAPMSVHGDENLMRQVCNKTRSPPNCWQCLISNPRSQEFGVRELAATGIFCAYNQSSLVQAVVTGFASTEMNQRFKAAYSDCVKIIDQQVGEKITVALNSWGNNNYIDSINKLSDATHGIISCRDGITLAGNVPMPRDLANGIQKLLFLTYNALQIVGLIPRSRRRRRPGADLVGDAALPSDGGRRMELCLAMSFAQRWQERAGGAVVAIVGFLGGNGGEGRGGDRGGGWVQQWMGVR